MGRLRGRPLHNILKKNGVTDKNDGQINLDNIYI